MRKVFQGTKPLTPNNGKIVTGGVRNGGIPAHFQ